MNELQIVFGTRPEPDRRYRTLVVLQRSDRPKYWTFHCPHCTEPLGELTNTEIVAISDTFDMQNTNLATAGLRCSGKYCRRWYYFSIAQ